MSKPIYTPGQVKQILDAANETMRKYADWRKQDDNGNEIWKPVETALALLESLKDGKVEIREIDDCKIKEPPEKSSRGELLRHFTREEKLEALNNLSKSGYYGPRPIEINGVIIFTDIESAEAWAADKCRSWNWKEPE